MKWSPAAEKAIARVPFFVRGRVKKRVEEEAHRNNARCVELEHVKLCQQHFFKGMEKEVEGHHIEHCFGPQGCPNRVAPDDGLITDLENLLSAKNLRDFLKGRVSGPLKMHHEFRIVLADCPNACSRPQIVDIGLIGALRPRISEKQCTECGSCVDVCREQAVTMDGGVQGPVIDFNKCLSCGHCVSACSTATISEAVRGYRVLVGGKLGRHPQLGRELPGIYNKQEVLAIVDRCLHHFMVHNRCGERFGEILNRTGIPADLLPDYRKAEG